MADSSKRRIAIASVLKPVDDTRMYEKFGISLTEKFEVHILGQRSTATPSHRITFHGIFSFKRLALARFFAGWKMLFKLRTVKPDAIIITTPELLWVGVLHKIFAGRSLYYDVLENYYWNISDGNSFPVIIRNIVAAQVRIAEILTSLFVDHFFLAEKKYASELSFAKPYTVLENKLPKSIAEKFRIKSPKGYSQMLFTGTLSKNTGVFEAIELVKNLHQYDSSFQLTIVGHCHLASEYRRLVKLVDAHSYIQLIGGNTLVAHVEILKHIAESDYGIIIYPPSLGTFTSVPTKLFEYLALRLPILARHNPETHSLIEDMNAGVVLREQPDYEKLAAELQKRNFSAQISDEIYWENEAQSLLLAIS